MQIRIHPDEPDEYRLLQAVEVLKRGGIIIYPTDTVYSMGCCISNVNAYKRLCAIKEIDSKKANFSIVCANLSHLSEYAIDISTPRYKILKRNLPGPFTFILSANRQVSKFFTYPKKTIGIRVPNHNLVKCLVEMVGEPIFSASIKNKDTILEYITDPEEVYLQWNDQVDLVIDGGYCSNIASGIYDISADDIIELRKGEFDIR